MTDYESKTYGLIRAFIKKQEEVNKKHTDWLVREQEKQDSRYETEEIATHNHRAWERRVEKTRHRAVIVEICALVMIGCALLSIAASLTRL